MSLSIGIVGLPNVGKSTLFETLTKKQVDRSNYPFATIDPNVGVVGVPDERLQKLAELSASEKTAPATVEFFDIAGLIEGAHKGEGLGNQFLSHIREVDAIVYVLRAFSAEHVVTTRAEVDPLGEKAVLDTELTLKDLETVSRRVEKLKKETQAGDKQAKKELAVLTRAQEALEDGRVLAEEEWDTKEQSVLRQYQLLTTKPRLHLLNGEGEEAKSAAERFEEQGLDFVMLNIRLEYDAVGLNEEERTELGLPAQSGVDVLIRRAYNLLNLLTFFTTGPQETRAWEVVSGSTAPTAAGRIHTDFQKKFIRADVINWQTLLKIGGWSEARSKGVLRSEGKEYVVQEGDVIEVKHAP